MKASDLRSQSVEELVALREKMQKDLFGLKMKNGTGQLADSSLLNKTRKDIARISGIITEKSTGGVA
jgi:large subunit ribosomal protein L29